MPTTTLVANLEVVSGTAGSQSFSPNLEVVSGGAATQSHAINLEVVSGAAASASRIINLEILEDAAQAGQPEVILRDLGQISRLRAELFDWQVNLRPGGQSPRTLILDADPEALSRYLNYVDEFLGPKVGIGPILDFIDLSYEWQLDAVGTWEATLPGLSPNLQPALDDTAHIIKFHFEGLGIVLVGWITEHEVDINGNLKLRGYDNAVFLARRSSFYRHHIRRAWGPQMFSWAAGFLLPATYVLNFGPNAGGDRKGDPSPTVEDIPNYFIDKRFQSQTVVEMWRDLGMYWGNHWIINPVGYDIYIDPMGDSSGKVISNSQEDDPQARLEGLIVIDSLTYRRSDEQLTNSLLPQGSNNAFGVAVELRHTRQQDKFGYYSDIPFVDLTFAHFGRSDELASVEDNTSVFDDETGTVSHKFTEDLQLNSELGQGASTTQFPYPNVFFSYAERETFSAEFDFAWAAAFGYMQIYGGGEDQLGIGDLWFRLCPDSGGQPDLNNPVVSIRGMSNYKGMSGMPEVVDNFENRASTNPVTGAFIPAGDKVNFCEAIWVPDQQLGFQRIPAGSYWKVVSLINDVGGICTWTAACTISATPQHVPPDSSLWRTITGEWIGQALRPLIEISGRYNTAQSIERYPYIVMCQFAPGIDDTKATSGQRIMYIRNNESIQEYGLRESVVSFHGATDSRQGVQDVAPAADVLYGSAVTWLNRHKQPFEYLTFDTVGYFNLPRPGQKVRVVYRGLAQVDETKRVWVDINNDFWVLGIRINVSEGGTRHSWTVANIPENFLDPNAIPYEVMRANARYNNYLAEVEYGTHVGIIRDDF